MPVDLHAGVRYAGILGPADNQTVVEDAAIPALYETRAGRKLANESLHAFSHLQGLARGGDSEPLTARAAVDHARLLRAHVHDYAVGAGTEDRPDPLASACRSVLHLCEAFLVDPTPDPSQRIVEWAASLPGTSGALSAAARLAMHPRPESDAEFWPTVGSLVATGRVNEARSLLARHGSRLPRGDAFEIAEVVLRALPTKARAGAGTQGGAPAVGEVPASEFMTHFRAWQSDVRAVRARRSDIRGEIDDHLFAILCGDEDALVRAAAGWPEHLAARVLFVNPSVKGFDVRARAEDSIRAMQSAGRAPQRLGGLDDIYLAVMDYDALRSLRLMSETLGFPWLTAHAADLLHHCGRLDEPGAMDEDRQVMEVAGYGDEQPLSLREHFVLAYVETLEPHAPSWQLRLEYLRHCPRRGLPAARLLLDRVPVDSERTCLLLQTLRKEFAGANAAAADIDQPVSVLATKYLNAGLTEPAIEMLGRCTNPKEIARRERLIEEGAGDAVRDGDLDDLIRALAGGEGAASYPTTAAAVVDLVRSRPLPRRYLFDVLFASVPLLESGEDHFGIAGTETLMRALAQLEGATADGDHLEQVPTFKIEAVRLALMRNLSRALLAP